MENKEIIDHTSLSIRIMHLRAEKFAQGEVLKQSFNEFVYTLNPVSIVKGSLHELAGDNEVKEDLAKVGLKMGANFILDKVLGKNKNIKGFLSSVLAEKVASSYINNYASSIISGISKLFHRKSEKETQ